MKEVSLDKFIRILGDMPAEIRMASVAGLDEGAKVIEAEAKDVLGTYQEEDTGPLAPWETLKPATLARHGLQGAAREDHSPLLRQGDLRDSIGHTVAYPEAMVGSDDEVAVYQELGTERIPPRSFLGLAAFRKGEEAAQLIVEAVTFAIRGVKWGGNRR